MTWLQAVMTLSQEDVTFTENWSQKASISKHTGQGVKEHDADKIHGCSSTLGNELEHSR
jgi:hypothetical protein